MKHTPGPWTAHWIEQLRGWCVLRFTGDQVRSGYAADFTMTALREAREPVLRKVIPEQPAKKPAPRKRRAA